MSAQKMREVVRQIQGLAALQARAVLQFVPRKGARVVIIRHGDREARLEAGASFWITFPAGEMKTTMASLVDDRRDSFTVSNLAHSIAGYFDSRFTR